MEGRGFSVLFKNSSEELFLKTVMESPIGMPVPTMDMIGFKTVSQSFRADSEELFKRWLTTDQEVS
jgi:alpha-glucosidase (family GH31 glycosyl hydrolase)